VSTEVGEETEEIEEGKGSEISHSQSGIFIVE
jgi:hypothetical protein